MKCRRKKTSLEKCYFVQITESKKKKKLVMVKKLPREKASCSGHTYEEK